MMKSGYPVSLVPSYMIATHTSFLTVWAGERKHHRRPDIRRGTNWPFPLSPPSDSNLAQFDLVSIHAIREARHSHKSHARLQSERQHGRFYGCEGQKLPADADGSIILCCYWLLASCLPD